MIDVDIFWNLNVYCILLYHGATTSKWFIISLVSNVESDHCTTMNSLTKAFRQYKVLKFWRID